MEGQATLLQNPMGPGNGAEAEYGAVEVREKSGAGCGAGYVVQGVNRKCHLSWFRDE
jgi:hypothetical protein